MIIWVKGRDVDINSIVNYFMGALLLVGCVISSLINPVLFIYHRNRGRKASISKRLFTLIAIFDFLTNSYPVIHFLYFIVDPTTYNMYVIPQRSVAGIAILLGFFLICSLSCTSQVSTAMLAVTRCLSVLKPFLKVPPWVVLGYVAVSSFGMAALNMTTMLCKILPVTPGLGGKVSKWCLIINVCQCLIGIIASVLTVLVLCCRQQVSSTTDKRTKSCHMILLMNLPYVASVILIIVTMTKMAGPVNFALVTFPLVACFTSCLNPVLIILLNSDARQFVSNWYYRVCMRVLGRAGEDLEKQQKERGQNFLKTMRLSRISTTEMYTLSEQRMSRTVSVTKRPLTEDSCEGVNQSVGASESDDF